MPVFDTKGTSEQRLRLRRSGRTMMSPGFGAANLALLRTFRSVEAAELRLMPSAFLPEATGCRAYLRRCRRLAVKFDQHVSLLSELSLKTNVSEKALIG